MLLIAALAAAPACDRDRAAPAPPPSGVPPLANAPAETALPAGHPALPAGHPALAAEPGAATGLPAGHPAVSPSGGPAGAMPATNEPLDPNARVVGRLTVAPSVKAEVKPGDVIFLVARADDGPARGQIVGVKRLVAGSFPMAFEMDGRDAMIPGMRLAGKVVLTARVDKDGDATTKNPGDVVGAAKAEVPAKDVELVLDTVTQ